jgi:hypothetical protein
VTHFTLSVKNVKLLIKVEKTAPVKQLNELQGKYVFHA